MHPNEQPKQCFDHPLYMDRILDLVFDLTQLFEILTKLHLFLRHKILFCITILLHKIILPENGTAFPVTKTRLSVGLPSKPSYMTSMQIYMKFFILFRDKKWLPLYWKTYIYISHLIFAQKVFKKKKKCFFIILHKKAKTQTTFFSLKKTQ